MDSAAIIGKQSEMSSQLFDLVLFTLIAVLVVQAERAIAVPLAVLFGLLGLVKTRHDRASLGRDCPIQYSS